MKGIIFNVGSETIKYSFFKDFEIINKEIIYAKPNKNLILNIFKKAEKEFKKIDVVAHRVVHGYGSKSNFLNKKILNNIANAIPLAPLHNPFQLKVIKIIKKEFPKLKQFIAFDSDIFLDLPLISKIYALPTKIIKKYKIYRYGFHGLNVENIIEELKKENLKNAIIFHLGAGCSITAIKNFKPIETSMGFTPFEGSIMINRSGSIDPGIVLFLIKKIGIKNTEKILNNSGILALANTKKFEKIIMLRNKNKKYNFAFNIFCYSIAKIASSYLINFEDIDAFVFSGGIGENSWPVREKIMKFLKVKIDKMKNIRNEKYLNNEKPYVLVIRADEEKIILKKLKERWKQN
ncbi:MAG: hypothetical protein QXQ30_00530 [Candidatus Pacearchaeota archaeon]